MAVYLIEDLENNLVDQIMKIYDNHYDAGDFDFIDDFSELIDTSLEEYDGSSYPDDDLPIDEFFTRMSKDYLEIFLDKLKDLDEKYHNESHSRWIDVDEGYEIEVLPSGKCKIFLNNSQLNGRYGYANSYEEALEVIEDHKELRATNKKRISQWKLIRELDPNSSRDVREAYREAGLYLDDFHRVGKYKDDEDVIHYRYI